MLLYQDELAQVWGRAAKYADAASPDFIPPVRRQIGDAKQGGFATWPAIPARPRAEIAHQPEAQAKDIVATSHIIP